MDWLLFLPLMLLPWLATFLGTMFGLVVNMNSPKRQGALLGFAAGVMLASSVWSLVIPAFEEAGSGPRAVVVVTLGFFLGCALILLLDKLLPHQHAGDDAPEGRPSHLSRPMLLVMAVALHNIPEGLALGIVLSAAMQPGGMTPWLAVAFGIGLALQNFPEGMAVVLPMRQAGMPAKKIRRFGILASFAEPAAALLAFFGANLLMKLDGLFLPLILAVAAGAMVFIIVEQLIPESQVSSEGHGHGATYGFLVGFWVMVALSVLGG
ncbi:ZIP family metal transporter [Oscillospiraceae bacterium OttesenSCG-928-G22]|nr:ZIP family metal transporter [Oscillospiraceae bacterium OttesenSCG-928-G22]